MVPILKGEVIAGERTFFWHNPAPRPSSTADLFSSAIREGKYKLVEFPSEERVELYDLNRDPGERENLTEKRPGDTKRLLGQLNAWREEVGASMVPKAKK